MKSHAQRFKFNTLVSGVLCLAVIACGNQLRHLRADDKPAKHLDGKWEVTYMEMGGKEQRGGGTMVWEFDEGKASTTSGSETAQFGVKRDDAADPKRVNLHRPEGDKGVVMRGIYKFDGEMLILCVATSRDDQPKQFLTNGEDGRILFKMKSVK